MPGLFKHGTHGDMLLLFRSDSHISIIVDDEFVINICPDCHYVGLRTCSLSLMVRFIYRQRRINLSIDMSIS